MARYFLEIVPANPNSSASVTYRRPRSDTVLLIFTAALVVYLVLTPLGMLIWNSFKATPPGVPGPLTLDNFINAYLDPTLYPLIANSFLYATGSTVFAFFIAFTMAWLVERTNAPLRDLAYVIAIVSTIIPGMIASIAWLMLLHPRIGLVNRALINIFGFSEPPFNIYTMTGMIFIGGLRHVPIMFLLLAGALRSMDPSLEESAATCGSGISATLRRITLPLMLPASAAAMIYSFINAVEAFEVPALIGIPARIYVFSTKIYLVMHQSPPDYGLSAALGMTVLMIAVVGTVFYQRVLTRGERYVTVTGKGYRPRAIDLGKGRYLGTVFLFTFLFLDVILPMLVLVWASLLPYYQVPSMRAFRSLSLASYVNALKYPGVLQSAQNSLLLSVVGGCITMFLAAIISWIVVRSKVPGRRLLDFLAFTPIAVPGIVMGLALMFVYLNLPIPIYGTIWILLIAFVTKYMPWATRNTNAGLLQIHKELEEASEVSGASWWQTFRRVLVPLLVATFASGFLYIFSHIMREISTAILLYSPKSNLLSIIIWELWQAGTIAEVGAVSVMLVLLLGVVTFIGRKYVGRLSVS
jgi:iron(III) transport system permease protein